MTTRVQVRDFVILFKRNNNGLLFVAVTMEVVLVVVGMDKLDEVGKTRRQREHSCIRCLEQVLASFSGAKLAVYLASDFFPAFAGTPLDLAHNISR